MRHYPIGGLTAASSKAAIAGVVPWKSGLRYPWWARWRLSLFFSGTLSDDLTNECAAYVTCNRPMTRATHKKANQHREPTNEWIKRPFGRRGDSGRPASAAGLAHGGHGAATQLVSLRFRHTVSGFFATSPDWGTGPRSRNSPSVPVRLSATRTLPLRGRLTALPLLPTPGESVSSPGVFGVRFAGGPAGASSVIRDHRSSHYSSSTSASRQPASCGPPAHGIRGPQSWQPFLDLGNIG